MFLNQPFPSYSPSYHLVRFTFLAGLVVFLILELFRPFHIDTPGNHYSILHAALYGLATFAVTTLNVMLLPLIFRNQFAEAKWTTGKEMVMMMWQIITVSLVNVLITHYLYGSPFSVNSAVNFLGITAAVGIFPVTLIILLKQQALYKKYASGAASLESRLEKKNTVPTLMPAEQALVQLTGDQLNEQLELPLDNIRYISVADNYIKVHYLHNGSLTNKVLRSTLKKCQDSLEQFPQLFRCHRTYIVNLGAVYHVSGNAQGYKLHLRDATELIPVSRNLHDQLNMHLSTYGAVSR